jgi:hypothetical protein
LLRIACWPVAALCLKSLYITNATSVVNKRRQGSLRTIKNRFTEDEFPPPTFCVRDKISLRLIKKFNSSTICNKTLVAGASGATYLNKKNRLGKKSEKK